tara:strand:+ start:32 stop:1051 length:1020 start_codon:yes stop_codon:yes gene_type:complete
MNQMKIINNNFTKNLMLIFLSVLLTLFFIEIILRFTGSKPSEKDTLLSIDEPITNKIDNELGWVTQKGVHRFKPWAKEGKITKLTINKDGSRFINSNNESLSKIIFIGGSITQGWAVDDKETFSYFLQEKFTNHKLYNFGVGGYGGYQSLLTLERIFKEKDNVKNVIYGFLPHHEVRNVAAGSWLFLLNKFSRKGIVKLPYGSIDEKDTLIRNQPIEYIKLPWSEYFALIAKIEKKIMKFKSYKREKNQSQISLKIINNMNNLSIKNNSKFHIVTLEKFGDNRTEKYERFFEESKISNFNCYLPTKKKYGVPGDGHPNELSHKIISECIFKNLKSENIN